MTEKTNKNMSKRKKILIGAIIAVIVLLLAVIVFASNYLVDYAIGRSGDGGDRNVEEIAFVEGDAETTRIEANRAAQAKATDEFLSRVPEREVSIISQDGIRLAGYIFVHEVSAQSGAQGSSKDAVHDAISSNDNRWAIIIHGYRGSHESDTTADMAQHYYDAGFNVLAPDLRASGNSDGDFVGMGWLDRLDILDWVNWVLDQDSSAKIVIHGVSMGAATTMMVSGEQTPDAVKAFVEDCGYTSVWDVFSSELSLRFGLPEFPLLYSASALSAMKAGYSFQEASALDAISRSDKPMLFIHGTADDFIPFEMMGDLYNAKTDGDKQMLVSEGAGHADAMYELSDVYWDTVFAFVDNYID